MAFMAHEQSRTYPKYDYVNVLRTEALKPPRGWNPSLCHRHPTFCRSRTTGMGMASSLLQLIDMLGIEEPLGISWADSVPVGSITPRPGVHSCVINWLRRARKERICVHFTQEARNCMGGWYYLGWTHPAPEPMMQFVTVGLGDRKGEHYLQTPEDMRRFTDHLDIQLQAKPFCIAQPLTMFAEGEAQLAVFHAPMELMNGLCALSFFALNDHNAVALPFGSGCANIFAWPLYYVRHGRKRTVLGGTDPSCRPFMGMNEMSMAMPIDILDTLVDAAPHSFLAAKTWGAVRKKAEKDAARTALER